MRYGMGREGGRKLEAWSVVAVVTFSVVLIYTNQLHSSSYITRACPAGEVSTVVTTVAIEEVWSVGEGRGCVQTLSFNPN